MPTQHRRRRVPLTGEPVPAVVQRVAARLLLSVVTLTQAHRLHPLRRRWPPQQQPRQSRRPARRGRSSRPPRTPACHRAPACARCGAEPGGDDIGESTTSYGCRTGSAQVPRRGEASRAVDKCPAVQRGQVAGSTSTSIVSRRARQGNGAYGQVVGRVPGGRVNRSGTGL